MKRFIFIDLGNCEVDDLGGKDLALTNAPDSVLKETSRYVKSSPDIGLPAEEVFMNQVRASGYEISLISAIEDIEVFSASADLY